MTKEAKQQHESALRVAICDCLESLQDLVPQWEQLLCDHPNASSFNTWEWLSAWWRVFGSDRKLLVLSFFDSRELVGLAPLSIHSRLVAGHVWLKLLLFMGDGTGDSDNLDILVRRGYENQVAIALLDFLHRERNRWDVCQLNTMPAASPFGQVLPTCLAARGWPTKSRRRPNSAVELPNEWQVYLGRLCSEDRKNVERYEKRLHRKYEVRFYRASCTQELSSCMERMFELHQRRWCVRGESGTLQSSRRQRFFLEIGRLFLDRGWLELWALDLNGQTVAVQFAFRYRCTVFQLQEGFDPGHLSDRVGTLLRAFVLKTLIREGIKKYDFLAGELGYKLRWGAVPGHYMDVHFVVKGSRGDYYMRTTRLVQTIWDGVAPLWRWCANSAL